MVVGRAGRVEGETNAMDDALCTIHHLAVRIGRLALPRIRNPEASGAAIRHRLRRIGARMHSIAKLAGTLAALVLGGCSGSIDRPLTGAARVGDLDEVRRLIGEGVKTDETNRAGQTALMLAARGNRQDLIIYLLDRGASLEAQNRNGATALHEAAEAGRSSNVTLLLSRGAPVDSPSRALNTPLWMAAAAGRREVVDLLIGKGAQVDRPNVVGVTPLMIAASNGHADVVQTLLDHGANQLIVSERFGTALLMAARGRHSAVVNLLTDALDKSASSPLKAVGAAAEVPLIAAVAIGDRGEVRRLLDGGADPERRNSAGWTALMAAAAIDDPESVAMLLKAGATIDRSTNDGATALTFAQANGSLAAIRVLSGDPASPAATGVDGSGGAPAGTQLEREDRAEESLKRSMGREANGTDLMAVLKITPLIGQIDRRPDLEPKLSAPVQESAASKATEELALAAFRGNLAGMEKAILDGAEVNGSGRRDLRSERSVRKEGGLRHANPICLIEKLNESIQDCRGPRIPLIEAVRGGNLKAVSLLVERGADVNLREDAFVLRALKRSRDGATAFSVVMVNCGNNAVSAGVRAGRIDILKYLLAHGAELNMSVTYESVVVSGGGIWKPGGFFQGTFLDPSGREHFYLSAGRGIYTDLTVSESREATVAELMKRSTIPGVAALAGN